MKYRDRLEILASILRAAKNDTHKWDITRKSGMSTVQTEKYLTYLIELGFVSMEHVDPSATKIVYKRTEMGEEFLKKYSCLKDLITPNIKANGMLKEEQNAPSDIGNEMTRDAYWKTRFNRSAWDIRKKLVEIASRKAMKFELEYQANLSVDQMKVYFPQIMELGHIVKIKDGRDTDGHEAVYTSTENGKRFIESYDRLMGHFDDFAGNNSNHIINHEKMADILHVLKTGRSRGATIRYRLGIGDSMSESHIHFLEELGMVKRSDGTNLDSWRKAVYERTELGKSYLDSYIDMRTTFYGLKDEAFFDEVPPSKIGREKPAQTF
jgi:predicted transcriptional regulator